MISLLKIELKKIVTNKTFWVLTGLYVLLLGLVFFGVQSVINEISTNASKTSSISIPKVSIYNFPDIWQNLTYLAGFFKIFLAVVIIIFITNEFSFKTIRQNIITGMSRFDFLLSKLQFLFLLSFGATLFIIITGLILGFINSSNISVTIIFSKFVFIFAYFLEVFSFLTFALLIGFLVKKSGLAIGLLLLYNYIIEPIIVYKLPDGIDEYMPLRAISNLIDIPNTALMQLVGINFRNYIAFTDVAVCIGYTALFTFLTYLILNKRDL